MPMQPARQRIVPRPPIDVVTAPFKRFVRMEASGGILLLICTAVALVWANSPWADGYHQLWERPWAIGLGSSSLIQTYHAWINDGLMALFFFLMGLEIKREILVGELSSLKSATFPLIAALGGSIVPMAVYLSFASAGHAQRGWAIPMATDIAFALGVMALLARSVPATLKVFVTALAIVDDVFGVMVIALFYTAHISLANLGLTVLGLVASCLANALGVRRPAVYAVIGIFVWLAVLNSGVHATIAGVLMAFTIPANTYADRDRFLRSSRSLLTEIGASAHHSTAEHDAYRALESTSALMQSPLHRIEHQIQPWVSFLIMPLFALANAGVHVLGNFSGAFTNRVLLGVALGLLVGKPLGITLFSAVAVKLRLASAPQNVNWKQIFSAGCLCGIGFTMSLFIASLAFGDGDLLDVAKVGTITGSVLAGLLGAVALKHTSVPKEVIRSAAAD